MSIVIERRSVKRTLILTSPRPRNEMNCPWTTPPVEKYSNSQCPQTWLAIRLRSRTTACAMAASMKELTMATWCHYPPPLLLLLLQLRWWWQRRRRYCSTWPWRQRRHTEIEQNVRGEAPHRPSVTMTTWIISSIKAPFEAHQASFKRSFVGVEMKNWPLFAGLKSGRLWPATTPPMDQGHDYWLYKYMTINNFDDINLRTTVSLRSTVILW